MKETNRTWKLQALDFSSAMHEALLEQHHAAQFIAMAGKYLLPARDDDSHTSMQYLVDRSLLVGNRLESEFRLALKLSELRIYLVKNGLDLLAGEITLRGKTRPDVFNDLKQMLEQNGIATQDLKEELHYELPHHPLMEGATFTGAADQAYQMNEIFRHNAEVILDEIVRASADAVPVRVWPHHFDTGSIIPLKFNDAGELQASIGMGWAIPDKMVDEPYYYLSYWKRAGDVDLTRLPSPETGDWMRTWNGGILRHSDLTTTRDADTQYQQVRSFFESGIAILRNL